MHEGVYTLPVIYALSSVVGELAALLGRKLEWPEVERVVDLVATPDVVDASMAVARTHATKASEALAGADRARRRRVRPAAHARSTGWSAARS